METKLSTAILFIEDIVNVAFVFSKTHSLKEPKSRSRSRPLVYSCDPLKRVHVKTTKLMGMLINGNIATSESDYNNYSFI